ncbi:MAG: hypothetical protein QOJ15_8128 [Bradyrhizobium sp.]|jgi:hypothetical protein|nr:hypothetical protein [Bradyrhizobium sp.]
MSAEDEDFSVDVVQAPTQKAGPPDDWPNPSWFDLPTRTWWWQKKPDPCPVRALGTVDGEYIFITAFGEIRRFTSAGLHGRGGLADLFGGSLWWPLRHFRKFDLEKEAHVGELQREECIAALMRCCVQAGFYDGSRPHRSVGVWRGPDRGPIVHAGDRIFHLGQVIEPGEQIGEALFVIGGEREPPAHTQQKKQRATFSWDPAPASLGRIVTAHLDEWNWDTAEARDLYQGGLHCDMLCSALSWLPHKFVLAPYGSGKSSLLRYSRALLGGGAHAVQRTYSKAYLEQKFAGTAAAFYLDETESDAEADRIRRVFELVRLLSDDGAEGGRGTSGGKSRTLDVHGTVTMAATVTGEWPPQDRSRITLLELQKFEDRGESRPPAPPEAMTAMLEAAAKMSATLRARALATWDLFHKNLKIARGAILDIGGQARDADQLGHLIAGWKTMISDDPLDENDQLIRFRPFIMSLVEAEDGEDAASSMLNTLFGLAPDIWRSGERRTIGQLIALGRADETESFECRKALLPNGLRLDKRDGEAWAQAWLAVANKHAGLDKLLAGYPSYQGPKRSQILGQLRRMLVGIEHKAQRSATPLRFAGVQSRYLLIPPLFLPSLEEE